MPLARALPVLVLAVMLGHATGARAEKPAPAPTPLPQWIAAFTDSLYEAARAQQGNLLVSPFSLHEALSMTREGATGETAKEMDAALHLPQGGAGDGYLRLVASLRPPVIRTESGEAPAYALNVANALWVKDGFALEAAFTDRLRDLYASPVSRLDLSQPARAREIVNAWASKETRGKIPTILPDDQPKPDTRLILTNAVYLKAAWANPFEEESTEDGTFRRQDGSEVKARLMHRIGGYAYRETADAQVLEIPYASRALSMIVVLPKAKDGLPALEAKERPSAAVPSEPRYESVDVTLPKFTFSWGGEVSATLRATGMRRAFEPTAEFAGMSAQEALMIGAVLHKTFVAVDEKGTEAAAVTAVLMAPTSAAPGHEPPKPIVFRADHPFRFLIVHRPTGTILFVGRLVDPS